MKKYIFILLALPFLLNSCLKNDTDIFGQIPGERIEQFNQEVNKILAAAPNGWEVNYYPGRALEYGGFKVYMKFDGDQNVTIASEVSSWLGKSIDDAAKETEKSLYAMGKDYGPTLNFVTENTLFHMFSQADLKKTIGVGKPGVGMGGDAEFIIMSADKDKIVLRGKKAQFDVTMTPLPADQTWEQSLKEYYTACKSMDVMSSYQLTLGGKTYEMSRYKDVLFWRHFSFDLSEAETLDASFQYTLTGILFRDPVVIDGISISEMKWDGSGFADATSGAKITTITSSNKFTVAVSKVEATKATVSVSPTIATEYYYIGAYPKADENSKSEVQIIQELMGKINSVSDLSKGNGVKSVKVKELTEYVACAFGIYVNGQGEITATTGLYKSDSFTTPKDVPATDAYKAWLGTWTVTSTSSEGTGSKIQLHVTIAENVRNSSYLIYGWDISTLAQKDYPGVATLSGTKLEISSNQTLGKYNAGTAMWMTLCLFDGGPEINFINGTFAAFTATLGADKKSAAVANYQGKYTSSDGSKGTYEAMSMTIFESRTDDRHYYVPVASGYTAADFPLGPYTMLKTGDATTVKIEALNHINYVVDLGVYSGATKYWAL